MASLAFAHRVMDQKEDQHQGYDGSEERVFCFRSERCGVMTKRQGLVAKFLQKIARHAALLGDLSGLSAKMTTGRVASGTVYSHIAGQGCQRSFTVEVDRSTGLLWPFSRPKKPVEKVYIFCGEGYR